MKGIKLIVPAIIIIPFGLAILATEFIWAKRLLKSFKEKTEELSETAKADVGSSVGEETMNEEGEVSMDEVSNNEEPTQEDTQEDQ